MALFVDNDMDVTVENLQLADDFAAIIDANLAVSLCRLDVTGTITGATNASPVVITAVAHGLSTGNQIVITDVEGSTTANGPQTITVVDTDHFSLDGTAAGGVYSSGGVWYLGVAGAVGLAMTYNGTLGRYKAVLPKALPIVNGSRYRLIRTCSNYGVQWEEDLIAQKRS